jgi:misacylated tRNA(Ala) deacylase
VATTVYGDDKVEIVHVAQEGAALPEPGARALCRIDWERRYRHMRMHTCMHLLCSIIPYPVTGGQVGAETSRLDFDIEDAGAVDKDQLTQELNRLIAADYPVSQRWITDDELAANPDLVRTMTVKPPMGSGRVRLMAIGDGAVDLQPCGGTHVRSTGEIGPVEVQKIEKKGRLNRRVRIGFAS